MLPTFAGEPKAKMTCCCSCGKTLGASNWHVCHNCKGGVHGGFDGCSKMVEESVANGSGHTPYFCMHKLCAAAAAAAAFKSKQTS